MEPSNINVTPFAESKLISSASYCGQAKVYVYNRCYGIAGLMGIMVAILVLGIYKRLM